MASKVKKVSATLVSFTASRIFFFFIFFQIPLFRFPCKIGTCMTPMELTSSQLIASELIPSGIVKALLYPGAIGKAILNRHPISNYNNLLEAYNLNNLKQAPSITDLQHIEVFAGSYLAVAGAMMGLVKSRRLGLFGMLLLIWGLLKNAIDINYLTMSITILSAFLSIKDDVKKIVSCFKGTFPKCKCK